MSRLHTAVVHILLATSLVGLSQQAISDNKIDMDDMSPFAEAAAAFIQDGAGGGGGMGVMGGLINNLIQSEGGKQLGDMLMGATGGNNGAAATGQILAGIGSLLNSQGSGGGIDPSLISNVIGMFADSGNQVDKGGKRSSNSRQDAGGFDIGSVLGLIGTFAGQNSENAEGVLSYLPMILNTLSAFTGPEAEQRAHDHAGHAWFLPPVLERLHLMFDHFIHSDMGRSVFKTVGAEKFVNTFRDKDGRIDFKKVTELLENQSFRRHWIRMVTNRLADIIILIADPKIYKKYMTTGQYFVNNFLATQGYPKAALFDPARPTETISNFINHSTKRFLNTQFDAKQYVKPAVEYGQEIFKLGRKQGFLPGSGVDSRALSHKLADTLNMEIIEPLARVYRAYRFVKKNPSCDKYVFCLVNQLNPQEVLSLPGLKSVLSKSSSAFAVWFLSGHTKTPFWDLYRMVTDETNCKQSFLDQCNDFHVEEVKVTTEYVHNEL